MIKPESGDVTSVGDSTSSSGREGGYSEQYWTPQYSLASSQHYHTNLASEQLGEAEEDSGDIAHYRDSAGPIRGYPAARSDAFVWRPY